MSIDSPTMGYTGGKYRTAWLGWQYVCQLHRGPRCPHALQY